MRCRAEVERNGYYTGKRCQREGTFMVTNTETEDARLLCTQHKNILLKRWWLQVDKGLVTVEEIAPTTL